MSGHYILQGRAAVPCDLMTWARWLETARDSRIVARTNISEGVTVSTVFLGLDHQWGAGGPPLIFETMVFGGPNDSLEERCSTYDEAEEQHARVVAAECKRQSSKADGGARAQDSGQATEPEPS